MEFNVVAIAPCFALRIDWAAWSAVATFLAAAVALFVGLAPMFMQRWDRRRRGRAAATIAVAVLEIQALTISAVIEVSKEKMTGGEYNEVLDTAKCLDSDLVKSLVDYMDVYEEKTAALVVDLATRTEMVLRAQRRHLKVGLHLNVDDCGFAGLYELYLNLLLRCQAALAKEVGLSDVTGQYAGDTKVMVAEIRRRAALKT